MSARMHVILATIGSLIFGFWAYLVAIPPSQQVDTLGMLVNLTPEHWKPFAAWSAKAASTILAIYAAMQAHPATPTLPPAQSVIPQQPKP